MDELEEARIGSRSTQLLDQSERDPATTVDGQARRLVERDEPVVLEQDRRLERRNNRRARCRCGRTGRASRRYAQHVPGRQAGIRSDAALVDAHLAASHDPIDVAFRHALQRPKQEIVHPLPGCLTVHGDPRHGILA